MSKYETFKAQYVEPSYADFLLDKFFNFPTFGNTSDPFYSYEAMTTGEIDSFAAAIDPEGKFPEDVLNMVRYRARTKVGNYLMQWVRYFANWKGSYREFANNHFSNAYDLWEWRNYDDGVYIGNIVSESSDDDDTFDRHVEDMIDWG